VQKGLKPYDPKDFAYLQDVVLKECSTKTPTTTSERSSKVPMHMAPYPVHLEQNNQYQGYHPPHAHPQPPHQVNVMVQRPPIVRQNSLTIPLGEEHHYEPVYQQPTYSMTNVYNKPPQRPMPPTHQPYPQDYRPPVAPHHPPAYGNSQQNYYQSYPRYEHEQTPKTGNPNMGFGDYHHEAMQYNREVPHMMARPYAQNYEHDQQQQHVDYDQGYYNSKSSYDYYPYEYTTDSENYYGSESTNNKQYPDYYNTGYEYGDEQAYEYGVSSGEGSYYGYQVPSHKGSEQLANSTNMNQHDYEFTTSHSSQSQSQKQVEFGNTNSSSMQKKFYEEQLTESQKTPNTLTTPDQVASPGLKNLKLNNDSGSSGSVDKKGEKKTSTYNLF